MKTNITKIISALFLFFMMSYTFAQVPEALNYQAVARNAAGDLLVSQAVGIRISIHTGSAAGAVVYSETHAPTTNNFGLFTLSIGTGTPVSGTFNTIDWSTGNYWLQVEMDPTGGVTYADMGTSQLLTVPYAMYAGSAGIKGDSNYIPKYAAAGGLKNSTFYENKNGFFGLNTNTPSAMLHIKGKHNAFTDGIRLEDDGSTEHGDILCGQEGLFYYSQSAGNDHIFYTNANHSSANPPFTIKDNGNIGIGYGTPTNRLEVNNGGSNNYKFRVSNFGGFYGFGQELSATSDAYFIGHGGAYWHFMHAPDLSSGYTAMVTLEGPDYFRPTYNNIVTLGSSSQKWVAVYATNGTIQTSDENFKTNIQDINYGLSAIMQLRPVSFNWKDDKAVLGTGTNLGFLAQDLEKIVPDVVVKSQTGINAETGQPMSPFNETYGVKYSELIPVLVKAIQEQQIEIENLKQEIKTLKKD